MASKKPKQISAKAGKVLKKPFVTILKAMPRKAKNTQQKPKK